jgi:hypothetical protein
MIPKCEQKLQRVHRSTRGAVFPDVSERRRQVPAVSSDCQQITDWLRCAVLRALSSSTVTPNPVTKLRG